MVLLLALACAHRGPARAESVPAPGAGSAAAAPAAAAGDASRSVCGPWSGVARVGTRWTYAPTDAYRESFGLDGTFTVEVTAIEGRTVTLSQAGDYRAPDGDGFAWERTDTWRCDREGAWWLSVEGRTWRGSGADRAPTDVSRRFAPGWLVRPAKMEPWTDAFRETSSVNGSAPPPEEITCATSVTGEGAREVGGRVVVARHVTPTCTDGERDPGWYGEGIGLLENAEERLIRYEP